MERTKLNHSYSWDANENQSNSKNCKNNLLEGKKMASAFIIVMIEKT